MSAMAYVSICVRSLCDIWISVVDAADFPSRIGINSPAFRNTIATRLHGAAIYNGNILEGEAERARKASKGKTEKKKNTNTRNCWSQLSLSRTNATPRKSSPRVLVPFARCSFDRCARIARIILLFLNTSYITSTFIYNIIESDCISCFVSRNFDKTTELKRSTLILFLEVLYST